MTIDATTAGSTENYTAVCYNPTSNVPAAPNVVYAVTVSAAGLLNLTLTAAAGSALVPALDIRTDAGEADAGGGDGGSAYCSMPGDCVSDGSTSAIFSQYVVPGTYYAIVTGRPGTSGAFSFAASLAASTCGDGVIEGSEACDPGTVPPDFDFIAPNDGCGAPGTADQCQFISAPPGDDVCPGQAVAVPAGVTVLPLTGGMSTYGFVDNYFGTCGGGEQLAGATAGESDGTGGLDRVFQLTPAESGTLTVKVGYDATGTTAYCAQSQYQATAACWASVLYARTTCNDGATQLTCQVGEANANILATTITFDVTANTPVWVFVDGYDNMNFSYGPFNLYLDLQ